AEIHDLDQMGAAAAVQLFCWKTQSVRPDFILTASNVSSVSAICTRLDGLPLAIELAAARGNVLSPQALLARLDHRLPLLTGGARDVPRRLRSMRDAIAWSYDLLEESEQRLFQRLAVFAGGFTEGAATAVVGKSLLEPVTMLDRLTSLVDNHLIVAAGEGDGAPRFTMLETIREFGLEQLETHGEANETHARHAAWCLELALHAKPIWFTSNQKQLSDQLEREYDNLRAALDWLASTDDRGAFVTLVGSVWPFWFVRSHWAEGVSRLRLALEWTDGHHTIERLRVLTGAGCLWIMQREEPGARAFNEEALSIARELGNVSPIDSPFNGLAICANVRGDYDEGARWNEEALAAFRGLGDTVPSALPLVSVILSNMAFVAYQRGETRRAKTLAEEGLVMQRDLGFTWAASDSLFLLARIAEDAGEADRATGMYRKSLGLAAEHRDLQQIVDHIDRYAVVDRDAGRLDRAALMLGAGNRIHELLGVEPGSTQQALLDGVKRDARTRLGESGFMESWQAGHNLSLHDTIAIASGIVVPSRPPGATPAAARWGVTPRELEVLRLLAEGRTDQEIADGLFISRRTVNTHVSHLLAKLDVPTRKQAVALARSEKVLPD
nr:hypothetical protein [Chloroflexia bacterium]